MLEKSLFLIFLDPLQLPEGSYKIKSICLLPFIFPLSRHFLGTVSLVLLNFFKVLEAHMKMCAIEPDFLEKLFYPQNWENGPQKGQKQVFLNLLKDLVVNFHSICSAMKNYIVCCVPAQVPY